MDSQNFKVWANCHKTFKDSRFIDVNIVDKQDKINNSK